MSKVYFSNLNGLRFVAAAMVLVSHIEQIKFLRGMSSFFGKGMFGSLGTIGVILFFVLSGFLITFLLIQEKENSAIKSISLRNFYMRRILRIWPLYFIVIILGLFVFPSIGLYEFSSNEGLSKNLYFIIPLLLFFLPNVVLVTFGGLPFIHQTWSIGTEEQFYLIWPHIVLKSTNLLKTIIKIVLGYSIIKIILSFFKGYKIISVIYPIVNTLSIFSLGIGGICGVLLYYYKPLIQSTMHSRIKNHTVFWGFICYFFIASYLPAVVRFDGFAIFFGYFILFLCIGKNIWILENTAINYLGIISYGIYMWHPIVISCVINFLKPNNSGIIYFLSFFITIALASMSYEFVEKNFLKLKKYYKPLS